MTLFVHRMQIRTRRVVVCLFSFVLLGGLRLAAAETATVVVDTPMAPPHWALLERELLRANTAACQEFYSRYFDERGYLECVERWGGDDGPDDAIENCAGWPLLHALGAPDVVRQLVEQAWEGHLRQYTEARTVDVPFARTGMYFKEFPVMFDWQHNNEGLRVFHQLGLSNPERPALCTRLRRFAGFYLNEDPGAPNYDARHKVIRSLFNGSRGPLMRKATGLDWAGDPIEVEHRFRLLHGERSYQEMWAHFKDYNDIVGDHPLNLLATSLALNAYLMTHEPKYKDWLLTYVDAWYDRMLSNNHIIPSNIGLDGTIGGACDGKWYGGVYGWGFTVVVPQNGELANRNRTHWGITGFMNAFLLTGDSRYIDIWRKQREAVNAQAMEVDGQRMYPRMHGDNGWYAYVPQPYGPNDHEIYFLSMLPADREPVSNRWFDYLDGSDPGYPVESLERDLMSIRRTVSEMRADTTTPDTRLADDPMRFNPARIDALRELMLGGIDAGRHGSVLHCRLRHFDPIGRRAGVPEDVAVLVESMNASDVAFVIVNTNPLETREVIVQAGAYAEHQFQQIRFDGRHVSIDAPSFRVVLQPGTGTRIIANQLRYHNRPTLQYPWRQN